MLGNDQHNLRIWLNTQPASNILGIFAVSSLNLSMFKTSREHLGNILKENIFLKVLDEKVIFVLKVYDLIITNVDIWQIPVITK